MTDITNNRWQVRPLYLELLVLLIFTAIISGFFPEMVYEGKIPNGGDVNGLYYPQLKFLGDELHAGRFPLWNPYVFSGTPFFANPHTGSAHLPHLLFFSLFPVERAFGLDMALHFILAGWFMYLLLRLYKTSRPAALLSGICFMLSPFVVTKILIPRGFFSAPFFPLMLYGIEYVIQKRNFKSIFICSIATMALLLCGDPQTVYMVLLTVIIYIIIRLCIKIIHVENRESFDSPMRLIGNILIFLFLLSFIGYGYYGGTSGKTMNMILVFFGIITLLYVMIIRIAKISFQWKHLLSICGLLFLSLIVGIGIASVQLIPALKLLPYTVRAGFPESDYFRAVNFPRIWYVVLQDFFSGGGMGDFEISAYIGTLPFLLLIASLFIPIKDKTHRSIKLIFSIIVIWALSIVFFNQAITGFSILHIPKFSTFFVLHRYLIVYVLAVSVLSGFAFDLFIKYKENTSSPNISITGFCIFVAFLCLLFSLTGSFTTINHLLPGVILIVLYFLSPGRLFSNWLFSIAVLSITVFELAPSVSGYDKNISFISPSYLYPQTQASIFLNQDTTLFRYYSVEDTTLREPTNMPPRFSRLLLPNSSAVYHVYDTQGFDPIFLNSYRKYIQRINLNQPQRNPYDDPLHFAIINPSDSPLISLLNVKYVISDMPFEIPYLHLLHVGSENIYLNSRFTKRAFLVHKIQVTKQDDLCWQWIHNSDFNPEQTVVLNDNLGKLQEQRSNVIGTTGKKFPAAHSIRVESASPDAGDFKRILIDDTDITDDLKGYAIAVLTPDNGDLESFKNFHTDVSRDEAFQMMEFIASIDTGKIVLVASKGFAQKFMTQDVMSTFQLFGAKGILDSTNLSSCAQVIIGVQGATPGQAMELDNLPIAQLSIPYSVPATYEYREEDLSPTEEMVRKNSGIFNRQDDVSITQYLPNKIVCRTTSTIPGILVMSEIYHPGWKVQIDDKLGIITRANGIFRAVYIPKGSHKVIFSYWPEGLTLGIFVTSSTLLLLFLAIALRIIFLLNQRKRVRQEQELIKKAESQSV